MELARLERQARNADSRLLRLPAELRNEIYRMCVPAKTESNDQSTDLRRVFREGLTRTCWTLRRETLPIFLHVGKLFSAIIFDERLGWDTKAEAIVAKTFTDTLAPYVPLKRVQFQLVIFCKACSLYGLKPRMCVDIEIPDHDSSAFTALINELREAKGFYMKEPVAVLGTLEDLVKRLNCANSWKRKSSRVEKHDVVDAMETIKKIVEGNEKRKWTKVWELRVVFETKS